MNTFKHEEELNMTWGQLTHSFQESSEVVLGLEGVLSGDGHFEVWLLRKLRRSKFAWEQVGNDAFSRFQASLYT